MYAYKYGTIIFCSTTSKGIYNLVISKFYVEVKRLVIEHSNIHIHMYL